MVAARGRCEVLAHRPRRQRLGRVAAAPCVGGGGGGGGGVAGEFGVRGHDVAVDSTWAGIDRARADRAKHALEARRRRCIACDSSAASHAAAALAAAAT